MAWFRNQYLTGLADTESPLAAPIKIPADAVLLLPPAYILTAEFDPLCDGGEAFAEKLRQAGVPVKYVCYPGMIHGFLGMTKFVDAGKKAVREMAAELKARFAVKSADTFQ